MLYENTAGRSFVRTMLLAFCLALAPAVAIGFGRFGYALILPAMRTDLGWSYGQAGALNTANALGYLFGALLTAPLLARVTNRTLLLYGLFASVAALFAAGMTHSYPLLLGCRALVGFAGAFTFISTTGLAAQLGSDEQENALALGLAISGPGIGTILTGLLVPFVLESGITAWPNAWQLMGVIGTVALIIVFAATRNLPDRVINRAVTNDSAIEKADYRSLLPILVAYFLFGLGYIAYMTFLVAYVRALNANAQTVALVWAMLGVSMIAAVFIWRGELAKNRGGRTVAQMGFISAVCALLPLFSNSLPVLLVSAMGFGATTMPIFAAITMLIRRHLPLASWNGAIAYATVVFALGQSLGPICSGKLSDIFGLSASLYWSAAILTLAGGVALLQRPKN